MQQHSAFDEVRAPVRHSNGPTQIDRHETGRRISFDLYRHGHTPDPVVCQPEIAEGWRHARATRIRVRATDRRERRWLQLRRQAHRRDRVFDEAITPEWLRKIDVDRCSVTREPLTRGYRVD